MKAILFNLKIKKGKGKRPDDLQLDIGINPYKGSLVEDFSGRGIPKKFGANYAYSFRKLVIALEPSGVELDKDSFANKLNLGSVKGSAKAGFEKTKHQQTGQKGTAAGEFCASKKFGGTTARGQIKGEASSEKGAGSQAKMSGSFRLGNISQAQLVVQDWLPSKPFWSLHVTDHYADAVSGACLDLDHRDIDLAKLSDKKKPKQDAKVGGRLKCQKREVFVSIDHLTLRDRLGLMRNLEDDNFRWAITKGGLAKAVRKLIADDLDQAKVDLKV